MIKTKLNLLGIDFLITETDQENIEGLNGQIDFQNQTIRISKNLKDNTKKRTILHEIVHLVFENYGLREALDAVDLNDEFFVKMVSNGLYTIFKSNKEEIKKLLFEDSF
jgi:Zn-dependent peptidase ImmA (M78 family)